VRRLLVTANVPGSRNFVTLMMAQLTSSETSVLKRATRRNIPEDAILHTYRRENLKTYKMYRKPQYLRLQMDTRPAVRGSLRTEWFWDIPYLYWSPMDDRN
jgi:hypothetical protein